MADARDPSPVAVENEGKLLAAATALAPLIRQCRDEIERERRLPANLVDVMRDAQLFQMWAPQSLGGPEASPSTVVNVIKELARADGSAGWCAAIASAAGLQAPGLPVPMAREIFGSRHIVTGVIFPIGKAVAVTGGFRLTGRWPYGSGIDFSDWVMLGGIVHDGEIPRRGRSGAPDARILFVPRSEVEVIDTWHVSGLRGTGSHDMRVANLFVSEARTMTPFALEGSSLSALYRVPPISLFVSALAAITLGLARAAIDALIELAGVKIPMTASGLLRDKPLAQHNIGRAEALVQAAEAFLRQASSAQWDEVTGGLPPSLEKRTQVRAAATFAGEASARAVDLMYEAAGASALHESGLIARCFRDVHAATQHIGLSSNTYELIGRTCLGLDVGTPHF